MAKYEKRGIGDFDKVVSHIHDAVMSRSSTISYEENSVYRNGDIKLAVRAYERYAYFGGNRSSLTITVLGDGDRVFVSAVATGGSSAMFFKVNTWSEKSFLETAINAIDTIVR